MELRLLVVGLDPAVLDPASASAARQVSYYKGYKADIVVLKLGAPTEVRLDESIRTFRPGGAGVVMLWNAFRLLRRLAREGKYDVATAQEPAICGTLIFLTRAAKRFHLQDHSAMFARPHRGLVSGIWSIIAHFIARRADRFRTVSERGRRGLQAIGIPPERIDIAAVTANIQLFRTVSHVSADHPRLLTIARLYKEKGVDVLLQAFKEVLGKHSEVTLTIIGDGPERNTLETLTKDLGIENSISFLGKTSSDDVRRSLEKSDIYVQSSRFEGWGVAVIEAAAAGVPVVMTDVGCAGEIIVDGRSGRVVPTEAPKRLAEAILQTIEKPDEAKKMAEAARQIVQQLPTNEALTATIRASLEKAALS